MFFYKWVFYQNANPSSENPVANKILTVYLLNCVEIKTLGKNSFTFERGKTTRIKSLVLNFIAICCVIGQNVMFSQCLSVCLVRIFWRSWHRNFTTTTVVDIDQSRSNLSTKVIGTQTDYFSNQTSTYFYLSKLSLRTWS